jgi:hypothetical protein
VRQPEGPRQARRDGVRTQALGLIEGRWSPWPCSALLASATTGGRILLGPRRCPRRGDLPAPQDARVAALSGPGTGQPSRRLTRSRSSPGRSTATGLPQVNGDGSVGSGTSWGCGPSSPTAGADPAGLHGLPPGSARLRLLREHHLHPLRSWPDLTRRFTMTKIAIQLAICRGGGCPGRWRSSGRTRSGTGGRSCSVSP